MAKYKIDKAFFPFSCFVPPLQSAQMAGWLGSKMRPPRWVQGNRDRETSIDKIQIRSYDGAEITLFIFTPRTMTDRSPCLVYYHGGGFFFEGAWYHYELARQYALATASRVVFVQYRLAPKHPHPTPAEDCYAALRFTFENAERLHIDKSRIAVAGDSAGGALAAAVCQMARDRATAMPLFQLLIYPVTDRRMHYDSCRRFTDTPMWNARLSVKMWQGYVPNEKAPLMAYASPMEAARFDALPTAYVETAEFDCLHDEGIAYADALRAAGVAVTLNDIRGTMHGFDIVKKAPLARAAVAARIAFMKRMFYGEDSASD